MASVSKRPRKLADGSNGDRWVVRYVDPATGRRPSKAFDMKKEADAFKRKVEREIEHGQHITSADALTVEAICDQYLKEASVRLADGRIGKARWRSLEICFRLRIRPTLGKQRFADLKATDIDRLYRDMRQGGRLAIRTAKDAIYNLQLVEQYAIKHGMAKQEPVTAALKDMRGTQIQPIRTFLATEVSHLLGTATTKGWKVKARSAAMVEVFCHLAAFSGLRLGEIGALMIAGSASAAGIDFERRLIRVRHSLTFDDEIKGPKTRAGKRDLPLPDHTAALLRRWLDTWAVPEDRGLIFRTSTGGIVTGANFYRSWTDLLVRAGLTHEDRPYHFHALRHFCASWMIENGLPVTDVAQLLGHSKFDMTLQTYAHPVVAPSTRHAAIEAMVRSLPAAPVTHGLLSI